MKLFKISEAKSHALHKGVETFELNALELKGINMKFSHHLPHAKMEGKVPVEHTIFIVFGELTVTTPDRGTFVVGPCDAIHFADGEERCVENRTDENAGVLIIDMGRGPHGPGGPGGPGGHDSPPPTK